MSTEVDIEEIEYLRHGDQALLARIFKPRGAGPFPALVEMHGGAWVDGNRAQNDSLNRPLAAAGIVVMALDFRAPPEATYPGSVQDVNYAIRWLKLNATRFGARADWVGVTGTSSGGHLAVLAAMKPHDPRYAAIRLSGGEHVDARVRFAMTLWPVICPLGRYQDAGANPPEKANADPPGPAIRQLRYWLNEEAMAEGSPRLALARGDKVELPNLLYVQNLADPIHPRANLEDFVARYRKAGGAVELHMMEGTPYDIVRSKPDSPGGQAAMRAMTEFVFRQTAAHARALNITLE